MSSPHPGSVPPGFGSTAAPGKGGAAVPPIAPAPAPRSHTGAGTRRSHNHQPAWGSQTPGPPTPVTPPVGYALVGRHGRLPAPQHSHQTG